MNLPSLRLPAVVLCILLVTACAGGTEPAADDGSPTGPAATNDPGPGADQPTTATEAFDLAALGGCAFVSIPDLETAVQDTGLTVTTEETGGDTLRCEWDPGLETVDDVTFVSSRVTLEVSDPMPGVDPSEWLERVRFGTPPVDTQEVDDLGEAALWVDSFAFYVLHGQRQWEISIFKADPANGLGTPIDQGLHEAVTRLIMNAAPAA